METKALEQEGKVRCFSTRQHNQFQVTFYINGRQSWLLARVEGCQPLCSLLTPQRPKQNSSGSFCLPALFRERVSAANTPRLRSEPRNNRPETDLRLGLKPGRSRKLIVRLETLWSHKAHRGEIMCTEFIFGPQIESHVMFLEWKHRKSCQQLCNGKHHIANKWRDPRVTDF